MEQYQIDQGMRLKKLIKALDLNQSSFAKSIGKTQPNINRIIGGTNSLSGEILNRISDRYSQVNLHWLLTGVGAMFLDATEHTNAPLEEEPFDGKGKFAALKEIVKRLEETVDEIKEKLDNLP